jgi:hypothetical protein
VAVEISNEPAVSALCVTAERDGWDQLIVAIGDNARRDWDRERPDRDERAAMRMQINQFTLPPEAILIWRMHGIVAVVLANLGAGADWGAIDAEYLHGEPASTPLGKAEAACFARHGRTTGAALAAAD